MSPAAPPTGKIGLGQAVCVQLSLWRNRGNLHRPAPSNLRHAPSHHSVSQGHTPTQPCPASLVSFPFKAADTKLSRPKSFAFDWTRAEFGVTTTDTVSRDRYSRYKSLQKQNVMGPLNTIHHLPLSHPALLMHTWMLWIRFRHFIQFVTLLIIMLIWLIVMLVEHKHTSVVSLYIDIFDSLLRSQP